jgi:hypothetical protein
MRTKRIIGLICVGLLAGLWCCGGASANGFVTVTPKVIIDPGGGISIQSGAPGGILDFEHMGAGEVLSKTLTLQVTANDEWDLTVTKDQDLYCAEVGAPGYDETMPSSSLTFTSNGDATGIYTVSATEFGATGSPASVVTDASAISNGEVNVFYQLDVPSAQLAGYYTAPVHTYTLVVGL